MAATKNHSASQHTPLSAKIPSNLASSKITKPATRSTRSKPSNSQSTHNPLNNNNSTISIPLLRAKLIFACRHYVTDDILYDAVITGFTSGFERWVTPATLKASLGGRKKRYFVVDAKTWEFEEYSSSYECRLHTQSLPINAGNGVVLFIKELPEWTAFMAGYKYQSKRSSGVLARDGHQQVERKWKDEWRRQCGIEGGWRDKNAGPMWVLVKSALRRMAKSETRDA